MKEKLNRAMWLFLAWAVLAAIGFIDWTTGTEISFFTFYFVPISITSWFIGIEASIVTSFLAAIIWFGVDYSLGYTHLTHFSAVWNTTIRLAAFLTIGWSVFKIRKLLQREKQLSEELSRSLSEIKVLESFLSICCECKKIRDEDGNWKIMEVYIGEHAGTRFSHGYCPECLAKAMKEVGRFKE